MRSTTEGEDRMRLAGGEEGKRRAKRLRQEMSLPEILLWRELRKQDVRFRRQHPAPPYTLDFYCAPASLAIEVDGEFHGRGDRPERDAIRDAWLAERGVRTLRIPGSAVLRDLEGVLAYILAEVATRIPPSTTGLNAGGPPPPLREGGIERDRIPPARGRGTA